MFGSFAHQHYWNDRMDEICEEIENVESARRNIRLAPRDLSAMGSQRKINNSKETVRLSIEHPSFQGLCAA